MAAIFLLFGDARINPVFAGRVQGGNGLRLLAGFLLSAADNAGRCQIEFGQIEPGVHVFRIQLHGALKFSANFSGQTGAAIKFARSAFSPYTRPSQRWKRLLSGSSAAAFLQEDSRAIPIFEREISAAKQVGRFRVRRSRRETAVQFGDGFIDPAGGQHVLCGVGGAGGQRCNHQQ